MLTACTEYKFVERSDTVPGGEPRIAVDPALLDMGTYELDGPSGTRLVAVSNVGEAPLTVSDARIAEPGGPFAVTWLGEAMLEPNEELDLVVEFTPTEEGTSRAQVVVSSNDPEEPETIVELSADVPETFIEEEPNVELTPYSHDFGVLTIPDTASMAFTVSNTGEANLDVHALRLDTTSVELSLSLEESSNGALPWSIAPGETRTVTVHYEPTDNGIDYGEVVVSSNDPDEPEATSPVSGNGRSFSGFSTGWYIYDDGLDHETTSSPSHVVDSHGDTDLYWYEPSGVHGLMGSSDPAADFALMRDYVIAGAGAPTEVTGPISFSSTSHLATFAFATYTYIACDFWIEPDEDPVLYAVGADAVDDGVQFMVNGEILGHMFLHSPPQHWSLHEVGRPGEVNTLIAILVDDSRTNRYLNNLRFTRDGVMIE